MLDSDGAAEPASVGCEVLVEPGRAGFAGGTEQVDATAAVDQKVKLRGELPFVLKASSIAGSSLLLAGARDLGCSKRGSETRTPRWRAASAVLARFGPHLVIRP